MFIFVGNNSFLSGILAQCEVRRRLPVHATPIEGTGLIKDPLHKERPQTAPFVQNIAARWRAIQVDLSRSSPQRILNKDDIPLGTEASYCQMTVS